METPYEELHEREHGMRKPFESHIQHNAGAGVMARPHFHDYIEMLYCLEGELLVSLGGNSFNFSKGDMVLINSKEIHSILAISNGNIQYIVVKFEPEVLYTTAQTIFEAKYLLPFTLNKSTHQRLFLENDIKNSFIPQSINEIYKEYNLQEYGFELAIRTHICRIFLWILRGWNNRDADLSIAYSLDDTTIEWLEKIFDFVQNEYQNPITVMDASKLCNMSYHYFSRKFKAIMKKSFSEYLTYVRITAAEKLLMTSEFNITEIAYEVGFSTSSYFIEQFKSYKSVSPKKFRDNLRK